MHDSNPRKSQFVSYALPGLLFFAALFLGSFLRLPDLGARPMHTDEAVHGVKLGELLDSGTFIYDPVEYHGPTLAFTTAILAKFSGKTAITEIDDAFLRLVPALYGIALIAMLPLFQLERWSLLSIAIITAISPVLTYFSRYFIMEMLFAFFLALAIAAGARYWQTKKIPWILVSGAALGLAHATKETIVIHLGAASLAISILWLCARRPPLPWKHLAIGTAAAACTSTLLFSSFGSHPQGIWDSIDTYRHYLTRSGGEGHQQPFWHYAQLLGWNTRSGITFSEGTILILAIIGSLSAKTSLTRFLGLYTLFSFLIYSTLSYKTPWTILATYHGAVILAGCGATWIITRLQHLAWKATSCAILLAASWHLLTQNTLANGRLAADPRNPWVYSHTTTNFQRLIQRLNDLRPLSEKPLSVQIALPEYGWPLPWSLRKYPTTGFHTEMPKAIQADVFITNSTDTIPGHTVDGPYGLRPGIFIYAHIRQDLWASLLKTRSQAK